MVGRVTELVEDLKERVRPEIVREYGVDSCIASTRIATEWLRAHGVRARPLKVQVEVYTHAMARRIIGDGQTLPGSDEWSIGVGLPGDLLAPNKWAGHLVCVVEGRIVVDLSIDQVSAPAPVHRTLW
jgi:hypothetical protein